MKLIADIGATNSRWIIKSENSSQVHKDKGFNPAFNLLEDFEKTLNKLPVENREMKAVHIYGAGITPVRKEPIHNLLKTVFPNAKKIELNDDLLGACRAMAQKTPALTCILGTGSNSCYYNGSTVENNIRPMGYILGDEGSAFAIGREIIRHFCRHQLNKELEEKLKSSYDVTKENITKILYANDRVNVAIAQYARFASENSDHPIIEKILDHKLGEFIDILTQYNKPNLPIYFTGSTACAFQKNINKILDEKNINKATYVPDIMAGLEKYHC